MFKKLTAAAVLLSLTASPALAHHGFQENPYRDRHRDNTGVIVGAGVIGLLIGVAIASSERRQERQEIEPEPYVSQDRYVREEPQPTARCFDGTFSYSLHRQDTCLHHGGVAIWF